MAPRNPFRVKEALISLLAGDIYGKTPIWALDLRAEGALLPGLARQPRAHRARPGSGAASTSATSRCRRREAPGGRAGGSLGLVLLSALGLAPAVRGRRAAAARAVDRGPGHKAAAGAPAARRAALGARHRRRRRALPRLPRLGPVAASTSCRCPTSPTAATLPARRPRRRARRSCSPARGSTSTSASAASVPTRSKDNDARAGHARPAPARFEIGPNLNVELWQSADRRLKLDLRLPLRAGDHAREPPALRSARRSRRTSTSTCAASSAAGTSACWPARCSATAATTATSTACAPRVRDADAARLRRAGRLRRLAGDRRAVAPLRQRSGSAASCATTTCAARASPPARSCAATARFTAGFGISWIFATSSQRVRGRRLTRATTGSARPASAARCCSRCVHRPARR